MNRYPLLGTITESMSEKLNGELQSQKIHVLD